MLQTKTTREISDKYKVSRQTINAWFNQGILEKPKKDFRDWYIWTEKDEKNLAKILKDKAEKNNQESNDFEIADASSLKISNRRYLGSKSKLLGFIQDVMEDKMSDIKVVADIFAGTGVVADMFAKQGKKVIVNDILYSNYISYKTWFGNESVNIKKIESIIQELNFLEATNDNYVSKHFGDKYFSMDNARKIGKVREKIDTYHINNRERAFILTSLLYAMDKVANTVGHYDAYRKKMDSYQTLYLRVPEYRENKSNSIYCEDANELVKKIKADLVYIDTPYNSRQYGDAYHLLENIIEWKKPKVEGVAKKMVNRSEIKSEYSMKHAPEVFDELIQNIEAKYILVSYNNMAQKGNGRSNAKISNQEILASLEKRGEIQVFETPFAPFTTGKTLISDHKELLYLCKTFDTPKRKRKQYIKSAINYTGGKHKLLEQMLPLFPEKIDNFYDLFAGGGNVGLNAQANFLHLNDINEEVINLYKVFKKQPIQKLLDKIESIIKEYGLSNTKLKGYNFYNVCSSNGLKETNEKYYLKLREDFNRGCFEKDEKYIVFYVLIVFAFNNQIRFNSGGSFNMPTGKRDFNISMENKLVTFKNAISKKNVFLTTKEYSSFLTTQFSENDFVYADPPYLISTATYNENGGWGEAEESELYEFLDSINQKNIKFALSNVIEHKGKENTILKKWSEKYNINYLKFDYKNSNYQTKQNGKTKEVLITNY